MHERCGKPGPHSKSQFPANNSVYHKCGKLGYYKSVCRSKFVQPRVRTAELESSDDSLLGPIYASDVSKVQSNSNKWTMSIEVNEQVANNI